jgi:CheY-like chemotaxis protein
MKSFRILLADDNMDNCSLFKEVLNEFQTTVNFVTVSDGEQLIRLLEKRKRLPHILFMDLNMPRKNGFDCLEEIKRHERYKSLPVIIFSNSYNPDIVSMLYQKGAHYYIQKPANSLKLKKAIHKALTQTVEEEFIKPSREKFVIHYS